MSLWKEIQNENIRKFEKLLLEGMACTGSSTEGPGAPGRPPWPCCAPVFTLQADEQEAPGDLPEASDSEVHSTAQKRKAGQPGSPEKRFRPGAEGLAVRPGRLS